jgi:hypothetical protein
MAYCFKLDESAETGLRRIASEQLRKVLSRLTVRRNEETAVHESRKTLKRLKALFKLVRAGLPAKQYAREYRVVRDAGRALSGMRDLEVLPLTLASLRATASDIDGVAVEQLGKAIDRARAKATAQATGDANFAAAVAALEKAADRYPRLELGDNSFPALAAGAADGLRALRRQHKVAVASGVDEDYHDWRKNAQLHWRHVRLLSQVWPVFMTARLSASKCLADTLGYDHDLTVLSHFIADVPVNQLGAARRCALLDTVRTRQLDLRHEARAYAGLLVVDRPRQFAKKLCAYHEARRDLAHLQAPFCDLFSEPSKN